MPRSIDCQAVARARPSIEACIVSDDRTTIDQTRPSLKIQELARRLAQYYWV